MTFYFLILFGSYFFLLIIFRIGWTKAVRLKKRDKAPDDLFISVVVPFRNEERNLEKLMRCLDRQNFRDYEVIFVNDHSSDRSLEKIQPVLKTLRNASVISLKESSGKKAALTKAIDLAKGEIIVTTDADCFSEPGWLSAVNGAFQDSKVNMAAGLVKIVERRDFFSEWQGMEFASVMGVGVASFGMNRPFMCNGANLAFRKKVFQEVKGYEGNETIASGDDEFLMRKILAKYSGSVCLLNEPDAHVTTAPQETITDFFHQRVRWASKWKSNPSISVKLFAVFIFLMQVSWIFFLAVLFKWSFASQLFFLFLKVGADLLFLLPIFRFMKVKFKLFPFLGLQFFYPFYVLVVALRAPWFGYRWKERYYRVVG